jgi:uncharacterized membrane protein
VQRTSGKKAKGKEIIGMTVYNVLKLIHILAAVIAIGFNLSYIVWLVKGKIENNHLLYSLRGVKFMDDKIANPCYVLALLTGVALSFVGNYSILSTGWIFYSLMLFAVVGTIGFGFFSPTLSKQIRLLQEKGRDSTEYKATDTKQTILGVILVVLALAILAIMVIKPALPAF